MTRFQAEEAAAIELGEISGDALGIPHDEETSDDDDSQ